MTPHLRRLPVMLAAAALPVMLLAACTGGGADSSGASASEAQQLNDAAAMLDANSVSTDAIADNSANTTGQ